jgi:hypothetical protein
VEDKQAMKINKNIIAKDLDSPLQLIEIEIEDGYITGEVLVGSGSYVKGKVYKMPYINFVLTSDKPKKDPIVKQVTDKFKQRSKVGIEKYGTTLAENNTDDFYIHLEEELMDSLLYLQKLKSQSLEKLSSDKIVNELIRRGYSVNIQPQKGAMIY